MINKADLIIYDELKQDKVQALLVLIDQIYSILGADICGFFFYISCLALY